MITVTFTRIRLQQGIILTPTPFTLYYKANADTTYTLIDSNVYVDEEGYILASPLPSITLDETGYYQFRAVNDFCGIDYVEDFYINNDTLYEWVEDDSYCEQNSPLNLTDTITGFADPYNVGYDSVTGKMFAVDASAITSGSNIYSFDAATITTSADVTPLGSLNVAALTSVIDSPNRFIYISGADTGGMIAYNIATDTVTNVPFGADAPYARLTLDKFGDVIICLDTPSLSVYLIDAPSLTITATIPFSSIPNYTEYFSTGTIVKLVNGNWWVLASQGAGLGIPASTIGVYSPDFSSLIRTISLPGQLTWTNSAYWRTATIIGNDLFLYDAGSNQFLKVDITTEIATSINTFTNREDKTNSFMSLIQDAVTNEFYLSGVYTDDANTDFAPIQITYKIDSTTYLPNTIYPNIAYGTPLVRMGLSDVLVGMYGGIRVYPSNPPGAATDGTINIFSKSGVGDNTGLKRILTLQEINTATDVPTGNVKANTIGDPDYIAPYEDFITCPIAYTSLCPPTNYTTVGAVTEYEYSLALSTANNPSIASIQIQQIDTVTSAILSTFTVPKNYYQHGYITKIGSNPNLVNLLFKDSLNNTLGSCGLFTTP